MPNKTKSHKKTKSFEQTLWETADKLRGTVESSEYKHVVLSLIFLKFVSDKFEARKQELIQDGKEANIDMVEFKTIRNVFCLTENSRWSLFSGAQLRPKQGRDGRDMLHRNRLRGILEI